MVPLLEEPLVLPVVLPVLPMLLPEVEPEPLAPAEPVVPELLEPVVPAPIVLLPVEPGDVPLVPWFWGAVLSVVLGVPVVPEDVCA